MPIYEYECECGEKEDKLLPMQDSSQPQVCTCGKVMRRIMSVPSFIMKQTGKGMALNTLNAKPQDGGMPDRHWKKAAEGYASAGL